MSTVHISVLLKEAIELLQLQMGGIYVDGTFGGGGHSRVICEQLGTSGLVIGMDRDPAAVIGCGEVIRSELAEKFGVSTFPLRLVHANFVHFDEAMEILGIDRIDGILLDLGLSSDQLASRGFGFDSLDKLDFRFDTSEGISAAEFLDKSSEEDIANVIYQFGEERFSRRIARNIVKMRESGQPVKTAHDLAKLVRASVPMQKRTKDVSKNMAGKNTVGKRKGTIDSATRTFQALRIAVNDELGSLKNTLEKLPQKIKPGGIAVVISFHSLEDRIVKEAFRNEKHFEVITKKPIIPTEEEIAKNPRARSAKLRAAKIR